MTTLHTPVCHLLGIDVPIFQAGMARYTTPQLVAAVSNAGGLGMLPLWTVDVDTLRQRVRETRSLTDRPFGVNLNLEWPQEERLAACIAEEVPIISFFWGDPGKLVDRAHAGAAPRPARSPIRR